MYKYKQGEIVILSNAVDYHSRHGFTKGDKVKISNGSLTDNDGTVIVNLTNGKTMWVYYYRLKKVNPKNKVGGKLL